MVSVARDWEPGWWFNAEDYDLESDAPPCTAECHCLQCQQLDAEEAALAEYEARRPADEPPRLVEAA